MDIVVYKIVITKLMANFSALLEESPKVTPNNDSHCDALKSLLLSMQALNRKFDTMKLNAVERKMATPAGGWNTAIGEEYSMPGDAKEDAAEDLANDDSTDTASQAGSDASFALGQCHRGPVETLAQVLPDIDDTKTRTLSQLAPSVYRPWFETLTRLSWGNEANTHEQCPVWFRHAIAIVAYAAAGVSMIRRYREGAFVSEKTEEKDRFMLEDQYQTLLTRLLRFAGKALAAHGEKPLFEVVDARQLKLQCDPLHATGETDMVLVFRGSRIAVMLELKLRFDKLKHLAQASGGGFALTAGLSSGNAWDMPTTPATRPYVFIIAPFMLSRMQFTSSSTLCQDLVPETRHRDTLVSSVASRLWASFQDLKGQLSAMEQAPNDTEGKLGDGPGGSDEDDSPPNTPRKRSGPTTRSAKAALFSPLKTPTRGSTQVTNVALGVGDDCEPFERDDNNAKMGSTGKSGKGKGGSRKALGELNVNSNVQRASFTVANLNRWNRGLSLLS